jgi:hypothetical protein
VPDSTLPFGILLGLVSLLVYVTTGYGTSMLALWVASLVVLVVYFWSRSAPAPRFPRREVIVPPALMVVFAPLYLAVVHRWPVQVSSDEVAIMDAAQQYAAQPNVDPFGLSTYLARPALLFLAWGDLGELIGGIDLFHMRLLHGVFGLLTIGASYLLLRQLLPRGWAVFAACVLGLSHAFFMISRLAMRENTAVLLEVVAFALLLWGLRDDHMLSTFLGGFVAGLCFYVYFPARATFPIWVMFLILLSLLFRSEFPRRRIVRAGLIGAAGFLLMASPIVIAESKAPDTAGALPQKETLMIYPEARELQKDWVFESSVAGGMWKNISWGLTAFNNKIVDHGFIYENEGHGFVDPLTGIFLWVGVLVVGIGLYRRRGDPGELFALCTFVVLWLSFAFLINKAPNYTRLLITLPFVAYFVAVATRFLAGRVQLIAADWRPQWAAQARVGFVAATIAAVGVLNLAIAWDFIQDGRKNGEPIGSTGRYIESHRDVPGKKFYLSADDANYMYYTFANGNSDRLRLFAHDGQVGQHIPPESLNGFRAEPPFAIFMTRSLWTVAERDLRASYPNAQLHDILPDGSRVVFEVPA